MTWRFYSISDEPISKEIAKILEQYAGAGTDPWHTDDHDFKDDKSAPWYRAIYRIYFYEDHDEFGALLAAGETPPEEMRPHIEELYNSHHFKKSKGGRPTVPSILKKSPLLLWRDAQLDYAADYAEAHGTTLITLLREEEAAAAASKNSDRLRIIQGLLQHYDKRYSSFRARLPTPK
jgi:hypothetical protein